MYTRNNILVRRTILGLTNKKLAHLTQNKLGEPVRPEELSKAIRFEPPEEAGRRPPKHDRIVNAADRVLTELENQK